MRREKDSRNTEEEGKVITPKTSIRYCLECIDNHLTLAHGYLEEALKFYNNDNCGNYKEHAWAAKKNISLAEKHIEKGPEEVREILLDEKEVLRLLRKILFKSRVTIMVCDESIFKPVDIKDRELSDPTEVLQEVKVGVYNVLQNIYRQVAHEIKEGRKEKEEPNEEKEKEGVAG